MLSNPGVWGVGRNSLRSFFYTVANLRDFRRLLSRPVWVIFRLQIRRQCLCPLLAFVKALPRRIWTWTDLTWSLENGPFSPSVLCGAMSQPTSGNCPSLVCISIPFSRVVGTNHGCQLNVLPGSAFANTGAPDIIYNNETQRPQKAQSSQTTHPDRKWLWFMGCRAQAASRGKKPLFSAGGRVPSVLSTFRRLQAAVTGSSETMEEPGLNQSHPTPLPSLKWVRVGGGGLKPRGANQEKGYARNGMGWDGMGWDGMGWDGMGWDGMN